MIECDLIGDLGSAEHMRRFTARAMSDRIPVSGSFDLTYRCNLHCVHCYCGHVAGQTAAQAGELGTDEVLGLLAEIAEAGCLNLLLSGGEPLLRHDFIDIYVAACRLGMITTVFTNATLMDERILAALREYPPHQVEVSVYGSTQAAYEAISGVRGSFDRAMGGIQALLDAGVRVALKTMILRDNLSDVEAIEALADDLGVRFRLDPLVTPRLNGDTTPLEQRVDPGTAAALEFRTQKRRVAAASFWERQAAIPDTDALYSCGAGLMGFHLDPAGVLHPCLMSQHIGLDTTALGFASAWRELVATMEALPGIEDSDCVECKWKVLCGYCPGLFALETGSPYVHSDYLCGLGERRLGIIQENCEVRGS